MTDDLSLPELRWLGRIIRQGQAVYHFTWCEDRLLDTGMIEVASDEYAGIVIAVLEPTNRGIRAYRQAREKWKENNA